MKQLYKYYVLFFTFLYIPLINFAQSFTNPLLIPPVLSGTSFTLIFAPSVHQFYPGINTDTYGINGDYLGPTLIFNKGDTVNIDVVNNLPESTSCHWHGLHVPAYYDGGPHSSINQGDTWHAHYKVMNNAATYWYHPHIHMTTQPQVTLGLAGMIIVKDSIENQLNLPRNYGIDDFPIILQDRKYSVSGQFLSYGLGDSMLVNGTVSPYLNCPKQMVRMRLLNGSNARVYKLGFNDQRNFYVIAGDGGLLQQPYLTNRLLLANGERAEIIVDLSGDVIGQPLFMMSFASEMPTTIPGAIIGPMGGNGPLEAVDFKLFEIDVALPTVNPVLTIPGILMPQSAWNPLSANRIRNKTVSGMGSVNGMGNFLLDNTSYNDTLFNDTVKLNDIEIWNVTNTSNIAHPIHLHDEQFYIVSRNGTAPSPQETGLKDVFLVSPNETVSIITKFEDYYNDTVPFMYHCHNLAHEDMGMMLQFIVVNTTTGVEEQELTNDPIVAYPNPSSENWHLAIVKLENKGVLFQLTNLQGKLMPADIIFQENTGAINIDNSHFENGIYLLKILTSKKSYTCKLVKF